VKRVFIKKSFLKLIMVDLKKTIRVCIVGVGNCASAIIQGVTKTKSEKCFKELEGVTFENIGGYKVKDIEFVGAYDVDSRKVGKGLGEAIFSKPNCCMVIHEDCKQDETLNCVKVFQGPRYDGVAKHMEKEDGFLPLEDKWDTEKIKQDVRKMSPDVIINYLPVGSQLATEFWALLCIDLKIPFLNCIPVFIASDPSWETKFVQAGIPLIGDDMRSQFGASVLSQMLQELALDRGHQVKCHIQQNSGGNTDFYNMMDKQRLQSKKISKENVLKAPHELLNKDSASSFMFAGPSDYIPYFEDKKVATIHMELTGFGGAPVILDARLTVQDSPNSAGVVIDAIRFLKVAHECEIKGALVGASAFTQKSPPRQLLFRDALYECQQLAQRKLTSLTLAQTL
jgi:myo-inositol-1-phosphate synthase